MYIYKRCLTRKWKELIVSKIDCPWTIYDREYVCVYRGECETDDREREREREREKREERERERERKRERKLEQKGQERARERGGQRKVEFKRGKRSWEGIGGRRGDGGGQRKVEERKGKKVEREGSREGIGEKWGERRERIRWPRILPTTPVLPSYCYIV